MQKNKRELDEKDRVAMYERERNILEHLKIYEQTIVAGQPFFGTVKNNAKKNIELLEIRES